MSYFGVLCVIISVMSVRSDTKTIYKSVKSRLQEISALEGISGLLGWDEMVMLPNQASAARGAQKEVLSGILYEKKSDVLLGQQLKQLHDSHSSELSNVEKANVRLAYNDYLRLVLLPKEMVQRQSRLETEGYNAWLDARKNKDFSLFEPTLSEWVALKREEAELIDKTQPMYDTLLYTFEKGMTTKRLDEVFTEVKAGLIPLINKIRASKSPRTYGHLTGSFDVEKQAKLCKEIALDLGFNEMCGRLDVSVHPFTGGSGPTDVRMTTRFKENDVTEGLTGAIHETGHSLYEQGRNLDNDYKDLPVSAALSMGVHESQSLLWERMVALSKPFQEYLLPKLQSSFPENNNLSKLTAGELYSAMNTVKQPSKIRVEADEVRLTFHYQKFINF
jgi:carboxypeptidase Taq